MFTYIYGELLNLSRIKAIVGHIYYALILYNLIIC